MIQVRPLLPFVDGNLFYSELLSIHGIIRDIAKKTEFPHFSNYVWFDHTQRNIRNQCVDLQCVDLPKLKLENSWTQNYEAKLWNLWISRKIKNREITRLVTLSHSRSLLLVISFCELSTISWQQICRLNWLLWCTAVDLVARLTGLADSSSLVPESSAIVTGQTLTSINFFGLWIS